MKWEAIHMYAAVMDNLFENIYTLIYVCIYNPSNSESTCVTLKAQIRTQTDILVVRGYAARVYYFQWLSLEYNCTQSENMHVNIYIFEDIQELEFTVDYKFVFVLCVYKKQCTSFFFVLENVFNWQINNHRYGANWIVKLRWIYQTVKNIQLP